MDVDGDCERGDNSLVTERQARETSGRSSAETMIRPCLMTLATVLLFAPSCTTPKPAGDYPDGSPQDASDRLDVSSRDASNHLDASVRDAGYDADESRITDARKESMDAGTDSDDAPSEETGADVDDASVEHVDAPDSGLCSRAGEPLACTTFLGSESPSRHDIAAFASAVGTGRHVVYRDAGGSLIDVSSSGGPWSSGENITQTTGVPQVTGSIAAWGWAAAPADEVAYVRGTHVYLLHNGGSGWQEEDLTATPGAPPSVQDGPITGFAYGNMQCVGYLSSDGHVWLLMLASGDAASWTAVDATASAFAPTAQVDGPLSGFASTTFQAAEIAYLSMDGHIHLVYTQNPAGSFRDGDITQMGAAPAIGFRTLLVAYALDASQAMGVEYTTPDGHVHEVSLSQSASRWLHTDLTSATGAPTARGDSALATFGWAPNEKHVAFVSSKNEIYDLYNQNGTWTVLNLTATAGAPIAVGQIAMTGDSVGPLVGFTGLDAHVSVLASKSGWTWTEIASGATSRW
jgi:hypothetical protein